jgi:hypothetical protein
MKPTNSRQCQSKALQSPQHAEDSVEDLVKKVKQLDEDDLVYLCERLKEDYFLAGRTGGEVTLVLWDELGYTPGGTEEGFHKFEIMKNLGLYYSMNLRELGQLSGPAADLEHEFKKRLKAQKRGPDPATDKVMIYVHDQFDELSEPSRTEILKRANELRCQHGLKPWGSVRSMQSSHDRWFRKRGKKVLKGRNSTK